MNPGKILFFSIVCIPLGACATLVTAWKNDPLQSYDVAGTSVYAMTGDRRTAIFFMGPDGTKRFCAESLPDAVAAFSATSKAAAALDGGPKAKGEASFEERAIAGLLQTFQRTESAELYRQMGWNTCIAWAQGGIDSSQYFNLLETMIDGGMAAIGKRADQPLPAIAFHTGFTVDPGTLSNPGSSGTNSSDGTVGTGTPKQ